MSGDQANKDTSAASKRQGWIGKLAGLLILVAILAFVALRLLPKLVKLFLLAVVVGAVLYLVREGRRDPTKSEPKSEPKS
ncbi:hypothetical protein G6O69_16150 [Pseudenhygromyxa sp. WMMC2535]|uniref:hypothetical protein n=1 Tax=Pseudenhygromyxa sp. WMMC2535 TaxID=2712867 RepID=UPI0015546321|nr:hypothetical protein [Pseudenhygromyxa sp. WMMC2535]NVB39375.1 hypothetical protein [Pseudenhygromyxa sp. WMMC2535]